MILPRGYYLDDRYIIDRKLGQGGFGITYLAINYVSNKKFAIKEFFPTQISVRGRDEISIIPHDKEKYFKFLKKFEEEAEVLKKLTHQNIVKVKEYFELNNTGYIVMPYIEGETLSQYLQNKNNLTEQEIVKIINAILDGLQEVHDKKYLHRDISPTNIYMKNNVVPMLIDFGSARLYMAEKVSIEILTNLCKDGYSPPEQYIRGKQDVYSDIYAISAVIYRMITGKIPPLSTARQNDIYKKKKDPIVDLEKEYKGKYSQKFLQAVMKGLDIDEEQRFQSIETFRAGLEASEPPFIFHPNIIHIVIWGLTSILILLAIIAIFE